MSTSLCFCRSAPMSENASLGTDFLPAIAKFRENVTLARRILPAGERSVRFNASGRWDFRLFIRLLGNKRTRLWAQQWSPEMAGSCRAARGRLDPCLGGGAVVALASGAISKTIALCFARSCHARYGVAIASSRAKALSTRFRAIRERAFLRYVSNLLINPL